MRVHLTQTFQDEGTGFGDGAGAQGQDEIAGTEFDERAGGSAVDGAGIDGIGVASLLQAPGEESGIEARQRRSEAA
jgi:hypothetical protein